MSLTQYEMQKLSKNFSKIEAMIAGMDTVLEQILERLDSLDSIKNELENVLIAMRRLNDESPDVEEQPKEKFKLKPYREQQTRTPDEVDTLDF